MASLRAALLLSSAGFAETRPLVAELETALESHQYQVDTKAFSFKESALAYVRSWLWDAKVGADGHGNELLIYYGGHGHRKDGRLIGSS